MRSLQPSQFYNLLANLPYLFTAWTLVSYQCLKFLLYLHLLPTLYTPLCPYHFRSWSTFHTPHSNTDGPMYFISLIPTSSFYTRHVPSLLQLLCLQQFLSATGSISAERGYLHYPLTAVNSHFVLSLAKLTNTCL